MGVVYKAWDPVMKRTVAIKMLRLQADEKDVIRFQREARALGKLKSEHIVSVSDFGRESDYVSYLVMDYLKGENLAERLARQDLPLDLDEAVELLRQICIAMDYAHSHGVLHRDLKPTNIIITSNHNDELLVKVLDFGLAKLAGEEGITESGIGMGSPPYMSPEQVRGGKVDERSDIYSFGCLMFEVLTGTRAFFANSAAETAQLQLEADPPFLVDIVGEESDRLVFQDIVTKCLEKDQQERYASFSDVLRGIEAVEAAPAKEEENETTDQESRGRSWLLFLIPGLALLSALILLNSFSGKPKHEIRKTHKTETLLSVNGLSDVQVKNGSCQAPGADDSDLENLRRVIGDQEVLSLSLDLSDLKGPGLRHFRDLPLNFITVSSSNISDQVLNEIGHFKLLTSIKLNRAQGITDEGIKYLTGLRLRHVSLIDTDIGDKGCEYLSQIKTLDHINLNECRRVTASGLRHLSTLPLLQILDLCKTEITKEKLDVLATFNALKRLNMRDTYGCTEDDISKLRSRLDIFIDQSFDEEKAELSKNKD